MRTYKARAGSIQGADWVQWVRSLRALLSSSSSPVCWNECGTNMERMLSTFFCSPTPKGWSQHRQTYTFLDRLSTLFTMVRSTIDGGAVQSAWGRESDQFSFD